MKLKPFYIIFKGFPIVRNCLRPESGIWIHSQNKKIISLYKKTFLHHLISHKCISRSVELYWLPSDQWFIRKDITAFEWCKINIATSKFGLLRIIKEPRHILNNSVSCIDLIFTSQPNLVMHSGGHCIRVVTIKYLRKIQPHYFLSSTLQAISMALSGSKYRSH